MPFESALEVFGESATEFFVEALENGRGLALPLELSGRGDPAFIDRMTGREYAAGMCVVFAEGRVDKLAATAAT